MRTPIQIRPTRPDDEPVVRRLQSLLPASDPAVANAACGGPLCGRLALEDRPVGYAIAAPGSVGTLLELAVEPEARGRGHGRALVDAIDGALEAESLVVTTPADDERAKAFYRSLGFECEASLPAFYDDRDGLRLRRGP